MIICALYRYTILLLELNYYSVTIRILSEFRAEKSSSSQTTTKDMIEVALNPCPELLDLRLGGGEDLPTAKDPCGIIRIQNNCSCQS